jgi:putative acetyltransferase
MMPMRNSLHGDVLIVEERPQDFGGIRRVNQLAFQGDYEANVVDALRQNCPEVLSLVARKGDDVIAHIMFSPVRIVTTTGQTVQGMGLGPLAVHPDEQRLGLGSALCREGMQRMKQSGYPFVIVLGHPDYYPRFGFERASRYGITSHFENVPDEAFMVAVFDGELMEGVMGTAYYREEFDSTD